MGQKAVVAEVPRAHEEQICFTVDMMSGERCGQLDGRIRNHRTAGIHHGALAVGVIAISLNNSPADIRHRGNRIEMIGMRIIFRAAVEEEHAVIYIGAIDIIPRG